MVLANAIQMMVLLGASKNENDTLKNAQQVVTDSLSNARTVQALGVEKSLVTMYVGLVDKAVQGMCKRNFLAGLGFGFASGMMFLNFCAGDTF